MSNTTAIEKKWHLIDAKNKILGRLSVEVAQILSGKNKVTYATNIDNGDNVVIINAKNIKLSGKKEEQKVYYKHSGYPGGLRAKTVAQTREKNPEGLIRHAVIGMLPKNKLGKAMLKKLYIYRENEHPFKDKIGN